MLSRSRRAASHRSRPSSPRDRANTSRRVPGESGTWVFLFGDMLVFGVFFVTFLVERAKAPEVFDVARRTLHIGVGVTNTLVLLTSSLCVVIAMGAIALGVGTIATKASHAAIGLRLAVHRTQGLRIRGTGHGRPRTRRQSLLPVLLHPHRAAPAPRLHRARPCSSFLLTPDPARPSSARPGWLSSRAVPASGIWSTCCGSSCSHCCTW